MSLSSHVAARLENLLKQYFQKKFGERYSQTRILEDLEKRHINISQSVLSKLMNKTYQFNTSHNKVFGNVSALLEMKPDELWTLVTADFNDKKSDINRIKIGIPSTATFTAPLLNALDKDFPDWLDLAHTHKPRNIYQPLFVNKDDYEEKLFADEAHRQPEEGTFSDCYLSGDLPQLLFHENESLNTGERCFDVILCPDELIKRKSTSPGPVTILSDDKNPIIKVATITNGFSGLACLFEKHPRPPGNKGLDDDVDIKNYHIEYVPKDFDTNELADVDSSVVENNKQKNFEDFLKELGKGNKKAPFCIYGFGSSASFKAFTDFLEQNFDKKTGNEERDNLIKKLYANPPQSIDFNTDDTKKYQEIAEAVRDGKRLLLIGYSPYMHNTWQLVSQKLKLSPKEYVKLTRFNFSQWLGKNSFSIYIAKSRCNSDNVKKLHALLKLISLKWNDIEKNRKLDSFFFYTKDGKNHLEPKLLYNRACKEMGFTENSGNKNEPGVLVKYAPEFVNYIMESGLI